MFIPGTLDNYIDFPKKIPGKWKYEDSLQGMNSYKSENEQSKDL